MDFKSNAMTCTMPKELAIPAGSNEIPGRSICFRAADARLHKLKRTQIGFQYCIIYPFHLRVNAFYGYGARKIGTVTANFTADIKGNNIPGLNHFASRNGVRQGRICPACNDRAEGKALRAIV